LVAKRKAERMMAEMMIARRVAAERITAGRTMAERVAQTEWRKELDQTGNWHCHQQGVSATWGQRRQHGWRQYEWWRYEWQW
jgi:hypothetical protein